MLPRYKSSSTFKISIGSIIVQAYFSIGVSQHRYFKEKKFVTKTLPGQKTLTIAHIPLHVNAYSL